jgi:hypothetical protein
MLAPDPLHKLFDGWATMIEPGEDFEYETREHIIDWNVDEDEELGPYESPSPEPVFASNPAVFDKNEPLPYHTQSMCWAAFSIALRSLSEIIGGKADAYQHNDYTDGKLNPPKYSFRFVPGETGWQCAEGARL